MKNIDNCNSNPKITTLENYGDLLKISEVAEVLRISKQTVYKEIKMGKFGSPIKFGREFRIPKIYITQRYLSGYENQS